MKKKHNSNNNNNKSTQESIRICIYQKNKNGVGGVAIDKETKQAIIIPRQNENFAMAGDEVKVSSRPEGSGKIFGVIKQIIKRNTTNLVGSIMELGDKYTLDVNNAKFGDTYVKILNIPREVDEEELFNCVINTYPTDQEPFFTVTLLNAIGKIGDDNAFINQILIEGNVPVEFDGDTLAQANRYGEIIDAKELIGREDLRNLPFVTIDGLDAKDFDDAVYCTYNDSDEIFTLYVAIADVANYVTPGSPLDEEAYERGTSIYFPRQVIPMLPERLSNGLCSLNPYVDRLVMCAEIKVNNTGELKDYKIYNGVINSKARLTYDKVEEWLKQIDLTPKELLDNITNLDRVYHALTKERARRGAIDFESTEAYFSFNAEGIVDAIIPRIRLESHKLIEECMLAANVCVADFLIKNEHPGLFRIHDKPSEDKFNNLKLYLNSLGIKFDIKYADLTPNAYADLLTHVAKHDQFPAIQQTVLRSMQLAVYSPNNLGHFGLSYPKYTHFTSPIRRYPDLLTHRALKKILAKGHYDYALPLETIGEQTSFTERRAEDLGRKADSFYKCQFAKTHIGSEFAGITTSVVNFGLFVYVPDLLLDGLIHVTQLGSDYFIFDENTQTLRGKKTGLTYHVGAKVKIKIANVDMANLFIDFELVTDKSPV